MFLQNPHLPLVKQLPPTMPYSIRNITLLLLDTLYFVLTNTLYSLLSTPLWDATHKASLSHTLPWSRHTQNLLIPYIALAVPHMLLVLQHLMRTD